MLDNNTNEFFDTLEHLKKVKNGICRQDVIQWFNDNNIDYFNMNDLEMYIFYIENNLDKNQDSWTNFPNFVLIKRQLFILSKTKTSKQ